MRANGYIIHLTRATQRMPQVEWIQKNSPVSLQVVEAVDGNVLTKAQLGAYTAKIHKPYYPFKLNAGEIGAFHSHRECWRRIAEGQYDAGLILEDDLEFDPYQFNRAINLVLSTATPDSYVRFPIRKREAFKYKFNPEKDIFIYRPQVIGLGAVGQIVGKNAAKRLMEATEVFDRPIDTFLQMRWVHRVDVISIWPTTIREVSAHLGGSLIQQKTHLTSKMMREIERIIYRYKNRKYTLR